ncbi:MAG: FMN-binding protein [Synergistaceae bacterium]|jgi:major membrane immunogen (membrane-anchored lipoprotein)|nr:FMN-binding protein [Synergistaceae bacterium]
MKIRNFLLLLALIIAAAGAYKYLSTGSGNREILRDGYYSAESASYDHGWKEFITIYVNNGKIVNVEYNAKNASGFIKSWDMEYMRVMNRAVGNYPNRYTRSYASALLSGQGSTEIDAVSGATDSYSSFKALAGAVVTQARAGDKRVAYVEGTHSDD